MTQGDREEFERSTREDIEELTEKLRGNPRWIGFREELLAKGHDPATLLLAFFGETEESEQHGALVTSDNRVLRFVRRPVPEDLRGRKYLAVLRDITEEPLMIQDFRDQIDMARRMVEERSIVR